MYGTNNLEFKSKFKKKRINIHEKDYEIIINLGKCRKCPWMR